MSPSVTANENRKEEKKQTFLPLNAGRAEGEPAHPDFQAVELMSAEEEGSPELGILRIFQQKIAGVRRLPRHQRAREVRVALEWLWSSMAALREKRLYERHPRRTLRRLKLARNPDLDCR